MTPDQTRIQELAHKWLTGTITPAEQTEFMNWYNHADDGQPIIIPKEFAADELTHGLRMYKNIYEKNKQSDEQDQEKSAPVRRVLFHNRPWLRYAAAIALILGIAVYLINRQTPTKRLIVHTKLFLFCMMWSHLGCVCMH